MIDTNWFSHESNWQKPDWFGQRRLFFFDIFKDRVENKLSQKFYHILAIEKQAVSFVEVACHLFMNRHNIFM